MPNQPTDPVRHARATLARSYRNATTTPAQRDQMRRNLTEAKLDRAIGEALAATPPLTAAQRAKLAARLSGGASK